LIQTLRNAWRIPELRKKLLFTLLIIVLFRLGSAIPVPYIDPEALANIFEQYSSTLLGFANVLSGGALSQATLFALSITPYINASIIMQLLTVAIPSLERMVKEGGEEGQKKIASATRYLTVVLGMILGFTYYMMLRNNALLSQTGVWPAIVIVLTFTAGTALIMWLGEQITEHGVGNGISIILFAGIVSRGPSMIFSIYQYFKSGTINILGIIGIVVLALAVVAFIVFMTNAERRVPVQYAKRVVGRKMYGGQSTHLPMKVNMSGVMPIIFASSLLAFPGTIALFFNPEAGTFWAGFVRVFSQSHPVYMILYVLLIFAFGFFYAAIQFNPIEVSNNLKKNGGFIPGFRPGKPTSDFLAKILNKVTLVGSLFLAIVAIIPLIMGAFMGLNNIAIGGTSLLIVVGVALETVKQIEAQMLMRHYKGFLE